MVCKDYWQPCSKYVSVITVAAVQSKTGYLAKVVMKTQENHWCLWRAVNIPKCCFASKENGEGSCPGKWIAGEWHIFAFHLAIKKKKRKRKCVLVVLGERERRLHSFCINIWNETSWPRGLERLRVEERERAFPAAVSQPVLALWHFWKYLGGPWAEGNVFCFAEMCSKCILGFLPNSKQRWIWG